MNQRILCTCRWQWTGENEVSSTSGNRIRNLSELKKWLDSNEMKGRKGSVSMSGQRVRKTEKGTDWNKTYEVGMMKNKSRVSNTGLQSQECGLRILSPSTDHIWSEYHAHNQRVNCYCFYLLSPLSIPSPVLSYVCIKWWPYGQDICIIAGWDVIMLWKKIFH